MPRKRSKTEVTRIAMSELMRKPIYDLLEAHPEGMTIDDMKEHIKLEKIYQMIGSMVYRKLLVGIYAGKSKKNGTRIKTYYLPKYAPNLDDVFRIITKENFALGELINIKLPTGTPRVIKETHPKSGLRKSEKTCVNVSQNLSNWPNI